MYLPNELNKILDLDEPDEEDYDLVATTTNLSLEVIEIS